MFTLEVYQPVDFSIKYINVKYIIFVLGTYAMYYYIILYR